MAHKILIIDDNEPVRVLLQTRLTRAGFECIEAPDGLSGIAAAKTEAPAFIICDLMMPDVDGWEVLKQLKEDPQTAKIPFAILSAHFTALSRQEGMARGADAVMQKPTPFEELLRIINHHLKIV
jgi:CheY-like chemotaxis protein